MEALGSSPWLLWALLGFGPTIIILGFGIRALCRNTGESWADFNDINTLLDWITPGLTVLAILSLAALDLTGYELALYIALPMLAYIIAGYLPGRLSRSRREVDIDRLTSARMFVAGNARLLGVTVFLIGHAFSHPELIGRMPLLNLFISMVFAGWVGEWTLGRLAPGLGEWKALAPGDLYKRVIEIASKCKVEVDDVRILKHYPEGFLNAVAHSGSSIGLGEELITKLNKDEVDAVIAHEVGHLGDDVLWQYSYPAYLIASLAWYGVVRYVERTIMSTPDLRYLQYLNWMAMFILPGLVARWYFRYSERKADMSLGVLENPGAAISGYCKLYLLNERPLNRPWWSRILGTHPTVMEDIEAIARRSGLSVEQVDEARRRAELEAESCPSDRYEIAYHDEPKSEVEKRGREAVDVAVILGAVLAGALVLSGSFFLLLRYDLEGWRIATAVVATFVTAALVIILPIDAYQKNRHSRLRTRIRNKLADKYGDECLSSMLLVDARINQDEDVWQGALIGVRDGRLILLGESRQVEIPLDGKVEVMRLNDDNSVGEEARMIVVWYEVESVRQWVVVRVLGRPEKGIPRNRKDLERHIRDLITGGGGTIRERGKVPVRRVLVRAPIALLILAGTAGLVELIARLAYVKDTIFIHGIMLFSVGFALYHWVTKRSPEESEEVDTSL